jgi:hypothetical protein
MPTPLDIIETGIPGAKRIRYRNHQVDGSPHIKIEFNNGYSLSVCTGPHFRTSPQGAVEVALIDKNGLIDYQLHDDVWGYVNGDKFLKIIEQVRNLPNAT